MEAFQQLLQIGPELQSELYAQLPDNGFGTEDTKYTTVNDQQLTSCLPDNSDAAWYQTETKIKA